MDQITGKTHKYAFTSFFGWLYGLKTHFYFTCQAHEFWTKMQNGEWNPNAYSLRNNVICLIHVDGKWKSVSFSWIFNLHGQSVGDALENWK